MLSKTEHSRRIITDSKNLTDSDRCLFICFCRIFMWNSGVAVFGTCRIVGIHLICVFWKGRKYINHFNTYLFAIINYLEYLLDRQIAFNLDKTCCESMSGPTLRRRLYLLSPKFSHTSSCKKNFSIKRTSFLGEVSSRSPGPFLFFVYSLFNIGYF